MPKTQEARPKAYGIQKLRETWVVKESVRRSMQSNRSTDTKPEKTIRKALWDAGLRGYRKNVRRLPGSPDVVFGPKRLAVFVHGCYWHRCPKCTADIHPKTNSKYWHAKFERNVARDKSNRLALRKLGYSVLVIWECDLKKSPDRVVARVRRKLESR